MFKQQKIELDALSVISKKGSITHKEILYHFIKIVGVVEANELFRNLNNGEYIELTKGQIASNPDLVKYSLSEIGMRHLEFLEDEKRKEKLQDDLEIVKYKLTKLQYNQTKWKWLYGIVGFIAGVVTTNAKDIWHLVKQLFQK